MSKISTLSLYGISGIKYQFEVYPLEETIDPVPGLYAITRRYAPPDSYYRHTVLYIGESEDLSADIKKHKNFKCLTDNDANCMCIHRDSKEKSRKFKVKDLIDHINPRCNKK